MRDDVPALLGGAPVRPDGPPGWPPEDDDVKAVLHALANDGSWGRYHGPHVETLERALAEYHQAPYALACASGTLAVEAALRALKVCPGDEVVLAAYDYEANFLTLHALGAKPVLIDVHPANWNLDPERVEAAISAKTKALIATHLHGGIVPVQRVVEIATQRGFAVIEDAAQAPGAMVAGRRAGSWGDVGILSFGGSKLLTAGRGGALLCRKGDVHQRAKLWLTRGIQHWGVLSEMQAAVLLPQLRKLDDRNATRAQRVRVLGELLRDVPGLRLFMNASVDDAPAYYKVGFQYDAAAFGLPRARFVAAMRAEGIAFDDGFRALHVGRGPGRFRAIDALTEAERAHHGVVMLHHPVLLGATADCEAIALAVRKTYRNANELRR